ncbi:hypothetical protein [Metamycoplasma neophronis]|uniref:Lipoprotein n=1 Tax=Metamycoplasma neophronis TaxID=872983 RepID=A0ABY2Z165_9BACT|nr:hypothetical protein [Metamycoplasma neophronis]TPR54717.1 hypothetical protein FJR74_00390 [Metamycoplasma neophronis]
MKKNKLLCGFLLASVATLPIIAASCTNKQISEDEKTNFYIEVTNSSNLSEENKSKMKSLILELKQTLAENNQQKKDKIWNEIFQIWKPYIQDLLENEYNSYINAFIAIQNGLSGVESARRLFEESSEKIKSLSSDPFVFVNKIKTLYHDLAQKHITLLNNLINSENLNLYTASHIEEGKTINVPVLANFENTYFIPVISEKTSDDKKIFEIKFSKTFALPLNVNYGGEINKNYLESNISIAQSMKKPLNSKIINDFHVTKSTRFYSLIDSYNKNNDIEINENNEIALSSKYDAEFFKNNVLLIQENTNLKTKMIAQNSFAYLYTLPLQISEDVLSQTKNLAATNESLFSLPNEFVNSPFEIFNSLNKVYYAIPRSQLVTLNEFLDALTATKPNSAEVWLTNFKTAISESRSLAENFKNIVLFEINKQLALASEINDEKLLEIKTNLSNLTLQAIVQTNVNYLNSQFKLFGLTGQEPNALINSFNQSQISQLNELLADENLFKINFNQFIWDILKQKSQNNQLWLFNFENQADQLQKTTILSSGTVLISFSNTSIEKTADNKFKVTFNLENEKSQSLIFNNITNIPIATSLNTEELEATKLNKTNIIFDKDLVATQMSSNMILYDKYELVDSDFDDEDHKNPNEIKLSSIYNQEFFNNNILIYIANVKKYALPVAQNNMQNQQFIYYELPVEIKENGVITNPWYLTTTKPYMNINSDNGQIVTKTGVFLALSRDSLNIILEYMKSTINSEN